MRKLFDISKSRALAKNDISEGDDILKSRQAEKWERKRETTRATRIFWLEKKKKRKKGVELTIKKSRSVDCLWLE